MSVRPQRVWWYLDEKPQVSNDPQKENTEEFDSKAGNTNPLFDFHFSERLGVIPGLVGGWLPDSCTATHSWTDQSFVESLCTATQSFLSNWLMYEFTKTSLFIQLD